MQYGTRGPGTFHRWFSKSLLLGLTALVSLEVGFAETQGQHNPGLFKRRPLARIRTWLRGTDLTINMNGSKASCQSTPVAKKELDSPAGMCRVAFLTAAHCVDSKMKSIDIAGLGEVPISSMKISIPDEYFRTGGGQSRESHQGDSATLIFDISCDRAENVIPVPLAPTLRDGTTAITTNHVYLQKRQEETVGNRGEGAQIKADVTSQGGNMFEFFAPSPQGYAIVGGDSGGPVFNEKGQLICPISGSSYEFKRETGQLTRPRNSEDSVLDPFTVICDKRAIARLKEDLKRFGLTPASGLEAGDAVADAGSSAGAGSQRPLAGAAGTPATLPQLGQLPSLGGEEGECKDGVCRIPDPHGPGAFLGGTDALPGLQQRAQSQLPSESETPQIPPRSSGGFSEVGPVRAADLENVMAEAKKKGFKHIVVRYGNDARCKYCRDLREELRRQFGSDSDVMVIKVEDARPIAGEGIPQSQLFSLDETKGDFEQQGGTRVGAGHGRAYKEQVKSERTEQAQERQQATRPETPAPERSQQQQAQPLRDSRRQEQAQRPATPAPQQAPPQEPSRLPSTDEDTIAAPEAPRNVFNGYQYKAAEEGGGLHFLKTGETPSAENGIFLKRLPDGTRKAARKDASGKLEFLPEDVQDGLRQYYTAHQDKVAHLPEKQRGYVENFIRGTAAATPPAEQLRAEAPQQQQPQQKPENHQSPQKEEKPKERPQAEKPAEKPEVTAENAVDFECVASKGGFAPKRRGENFRPLGASVFKDKALCERAVANSKNGAVCSFTGIGFKPTHFSGSIPKRTDYGYLGGSSITNFEDCLKATLNATDKAICYYGGEGTRWYSGDIHGTNQHPAGVPRGPFNSVDACIAAINGDAELKKPYATLAERKPAEDKPQQEEKPKAEVKPVPESKPAQDEKLASSHAVFGNHCAGCHSPGSQKVNVPEWATDVKELQSRLASADPKVKAEAQTWAKKLHAVLVEHNNMPPTEADKKRMEKDPQVQALRAFLTQHQSREVASAPATNATQVLPPEKLAQYREMLSRVKVGDQEIMAVLQDPSTLIFDDKAMPAGYQDTSLPVQGFRPSGHTTFAEGAPFLDENNRLKLFTKGVGMSADAQTFHMLSLPKDENGKLKPVEYWTEKDAKDGGTLYRWRFPEGTVSVEAIVQKDSQGQPYVVELRTRKKDGLNGAAEANIFSAAPSKEALETRLAQIAQTNPNLAAEAKAIQRQLGSLELRPVEIDNGQYRTRFGSQGATATLPKMSEPLVRELLSELSSARGTSWDQEGGRTAFAPTTDQQFGIVPYHSTRGAVSVDRQSCNTCHASSNTPVRDAFNYNQATGAFRDLLNRTTYLYGNFPGSDGNLRFHIFDPSTMPIFGRDSVQDNRRINPALAPILRRVN